MLFLIKPVYTGIKHIHTSFLQMLQLQDGQESPSRGEGVAECSSVLPGLLPHVAIGGHSVLHQTLRDHWLMLLTLCYALTERRI